MTDDNYPFDRDHVMVDVSFPVAQLPDRDALFGIVRQLAERRGGREAGTAGPLPAFRGRPCHETFGMAVAFEAGDAGIHAFQAMIRAEQKLTVSGEQVSCNPEDVFAADADAEDRKPALRR
jgi:hypothetical protein